MADQYKKSKVSLPWLALPWCLGARIRFPKKPQGTSNKALMVADLVIGFRMMRARYTSRVTLQSPRRIDVTCIEGPFRYLDNHWAFEPVAPSAGRPAGGTMITFQIEFAFRSSLLQSLMGVLFDEAISRMVAAFEGRAKQLYGTGPSGAAPRSPHRTIARSVGMAMAWRSAHPTAHRGQPAPTSQGPGANSR